MGARTHRELAAWRLANEVRQAVILICRKDPVSRDKAYVGQALTASGSACRNIAAGEYDAVLTRLLRAKRASNGLRRYLQNTPTPAEHLRTRTSTSTSTK